MQRFQSTPSAWRETRGTVVKWCCRPISIHSLRVEGDRSPVNCHCPNIEFQSTPSAWRETTVTERGTSGATISIHSLRVEGDTNDTTNTTTKKDFNPLPPRGGRLPSRFCKICSSDFNPLPPRGGRPFSAEVKSLGLTISIHSLRVEGDNARGRERPWRVHISIHSLRVEGDRQRIQRRNRFINFNPLPPRGGRPLRLKPFARLRTFQSTPSAWRETWSELQSAKYPELFQSTPSAWRETVARISILRLRTYFNPLPPRGGRRWVYIITR